MSLGDPRERPPAVVVLGAGISGLVAAHTVRSERPGTSVTVVDASAGVGGKLALTEIGHHTLDAGADAFLARVPAAVELCRELGLSDELVSPAQRSALLLQAGRLQPLPDGLMLGVPTDLDAVRASGLISEHGLARAERDLGANDPPLAGDESVGRYARHHLGDEVYDVLVRPLLSGINAGDADELSLLAGAPQLAAAAHAGGSLVEFARRRRAEATDPAAPVFHSLRGGAGRLAAVLGDELSDHLLLGTTAERIRLANRGDYTVNLRTSEGRTRTLSADAVVIALPAFAAATIVRNLSKRVANGLAELDYASVTVAIARYPRNRIAHPLAASGYLVPESEGLVTTAGSFGSSKWPAWADHDQVILRFSAGRFHDTRALDLDDDELVARVITEATGPLGLEGPPAEAKVVRWPRALPQYRPGHLDRVTEWETRLARDAPGVVLAGASLRGLGVPACVTSGREAAATALAHVDHLATRP